MSGVDSSPSSPPPPPPPPPHKTAKLKDDAIDPDSHRSMDPQRSTVARHAGHAL